MSGHDYPASEVIVLARLFQHFEAMCPVTGETFAEPREMTGLTRDMLVEYGDDWLDVQAVDVPAGWLVRITQWAELTSDQAPGIVDYVGSSERGRWLPRATAMAMVRAKGQLRRFARLRRWGGSR